MVEGRPSHVERNGARKTRRQENRKGTKAFSRCNERDGSEAGCLPEHELNCNTASCSSSTCTNPCRLYRQGFSLCRSPSYTRLSRSPRRSRCRTRRPRHRATDTINVAGCHQLQRRLRRIAFTLGSFSAARLVLAGVADSDSPATPPK
jgi:hypothetical protein